MMDYIKAYDSFPYPSIPHPLSHPNHLETIARLFNVPVANSTSARILEIGAGSGGNVIPLAEQLPGCQFVAIDLSAGQVAEGNRIITQLGLRNIDFRHADLMTLDESYGEFDYIICHGVFSWVPKEYSSRILQVCRERLAPHGVAYVSYNTYPGWHMRDLLRSMLLFHLRAVTDLTERVKQARLFLSYLAESVPDEMSTYALFLATENEVFTQSPDNYLLHDILEEHNHPIYFHEFHELAARHHLCYLGDSQVKSMWLGNSDSGTARGPGSLPNTLVDREQTNDFIHNRSFRQSLLCHEGITIDRTIYASVLREMFVSSQLRASPPETPSTRQVGPAMTKFVDHAGVYRLGTQDPLVVETLQRLSAARPSSIPFKSLIQTALANTTSQPVNRDTFSQVEKALAECLIQLYSVGLVELGACPDRFTTQVSAKPRVSPLAAFQAASGQQYLTNRRHESITCEPLAYHMLQLADGSRTRDQLGQALTEKVRLAGLPGTPHLTATSVGAEEINRFLQHSIDRALQSLARNCFLIA